MKTRRKFLKAASVSFAAQMAEHPLLSASQAVEPGGDLPYDRDYWNDLPAHTIALVESARRRRKEALAKVTTKQQSAERASFVRDKVWGLIGGQLEKTPLKVQSVGIIERQNYRIEKLIFQTQPAFYVPAHLYLPKVGTAPYPCVISPLGHTPEGKEYQSYQTLFQNLARMGFAVLTWDPPSQGERLQYPMPGTNRTRFGPTGEHDRFGWPALLIGSTTTQFEVWDAVRALDYLLTRPEVDKERVGCCGHSGGGTLTMYLCALEPRIKAAVVVEGHTENITNAAYEPPGAYADAEQNMIGSLSVGLDRGDLLNSFAPKPLLICFTHMDVGATYSPHYEEGTLEIFSELQRIYGIYNAPTKVGLSSSGLPHDYDFFHRSATHAWFNKYLGSGHSDKHEAPFEEASGLELHCTSTGQILTSFKGRAAYQVNSDRLRLMQAQKGSEEIPAEQLRKTLRPLLALPSRANQVRKRTLWRGNLQGLSVEEFDFFSDAKVRVPGYFVKPQSAGTKLPVVLTVSSAGKNHIFNDPSLLMEAARLNVAVCSVDTRGSGRTIPRLPSSGPSFYSHGVETAYSMISLTAGSPLLGQRVWDVIRCLDYLTTRSDVDSSRISIFGTGAKGLEALFAATLDDRIQNVLLSHVLADFTSVVRSEDYSVDLGSVVFGLLQNFDLPEMCAALAPRLLWLLNPVNAKGEGLPVNEVRERYASAFKTYSRSKPDAFTVRTEPDGTAATLSSWLQVTAGRS